MKRQSLVLISALIALAIGLLLGSLMTTPLAAQTATSTPVATATTVATAVLSPTVAATATAGPSPTATPFEVKGRLKTVLDRGKLICGINGQLAGFSVLEADSSYSGLDAEFCRAVAAAVFSDTTKVEYRPLSAQERFAAVQNGEVDVLMRNTTFTLSRDTAVGMEFLPTTFFDGGGMLVAKSANIEELEALDGATICVLSGTTNEQVLTDVFTANNIKFTPLTFKDATSLYKALDEGRCDAATSDKSQLAGQRASLLSKPDDWEIMDETLSKEPLGPAVMQNDEQWADVVRWVIYATFYAEELGIDSKTVDEAKNSKDTNVQRFLGLTGSLGKDMGLTNDAFYRVIKLVGNYSEIFEKTLGPNTKFNVPRGLNQSYLEGGLQYSPPFR